MEALLDSIRVAVSPGASDAERARGAVACRALAERLQPAAEPTAAPTSTSPSASTTSPAPSPVVLTSQPNPFAGLSLDQVLDVVLAKLRHAAGTQPASAPAGQPFQIHLVPVPPVRR